MDIATDIVGHIGHRQGATSTVQEGAPPTSQNDNPLMGMTVDPASHHVYIAHGGKSEKSVSVIDPATGAVTAVPVGNSTADVAVDPVHNVLLTANYMDNTVSVIDLATRTVTAHIAVGEDPANIFSTFTVDISVLHSD